MSEYFELPPEIRKEDFKRSTRLLRQECFVVKSIESHRSIFNFIKRNEDVFRSYFELDDTELEIDEQSGVATLKNESGRLRFSKFETIVLLIMRGEYALCLREITGTSNVFIPLETICDKYQSLNMKVKPDAQAFFNELCNALRKFKRYNIVGYQGKIDGKSTETQIAIYPSIMFAAKSDNLKDILEATKIELERFEVDSSENDDVDE